MFGKKNIILKTVQRHIIENEEVKGKLSKDGNALSFTDLLEFMRKNAHDQAKELESHVESLVHSKPDFGYPEQLEFGDRNPN